MVMDTNIVSKRTDLTVSGLAIFSVEVSPVAVLVPPGSFVGQGTVSYSNVIVSVFSGEWPTLVVAERVTCDQRRIGQSNNYPRNVGIFLTYGERY